MNPTSERMQQLNCNNWGATKKWFNTKSQYAGIYIMDPISAVPVDATTCDIKYQYLPVPNGPRTDAGIDFRRFTYDQNGNILGMGDWKSGVKNM